MDKAKSTLLYIPDISGFTDFVNKTEINHSRHIISELLEIIINSDKFDMSVSEVEGDAILFFKDKVPSVSDLIEQCKHTFINFHNHLLKYDTERICRCGACETANKLSLKFIIHQGEVERLNIKDHKKLHGWDVILAHKLLKNSITENEYILITDSFGLDLDTIDKLDKEWVSIKRESDTYENVGKYDYSYIPIHPLLEILNEPTPVSFPRLSSNKIIAENIIQAPIGHTYENYADLDKRMEWNDDIKDVILRDKGLNKTGSLHTCLVGQHSLDIESLGRLEDEEQIVYGERLNEFKGLQDILTIYTFVKEGENTRVKVEVDYKIRSWFGRLLRPFLQRMFQKRTEKGLKLLKKASEENGG